jgi:hypothetical protein
MKKLILVALLVAGTSLIAQPKNKKQQNNGKSEFTMEQQIQLKVKKLTLALDLNESQQKEITPIIADKMAKREAMKKEMQSKKESSVRPTSDERFAMQMKKLDEKIADKKRMEKILTPSQYEKWTALNENHKKGGKQGKQKRGSSDDDQGRKS